MQNVPKLNDPLPFFFHKPSKRVLYVAEGPCPFVFTITIDDLMKHEAVVNDGPVMSKTTHPFGLTTGVSSLAEDGTRRGLADTTVMVAGMLENTLTLWSDFCDAVTEALNDGKDLKTALAETWTIEDDAEINLHDDAAMVGA